MGRPPSYQHYARDFLAETLAMSMHHRGVLITVRSAMWLSDEPGTLPLPLEIAARAARLDPRSLRDFVAKWPRCFAEIDGKLVDEGLVKNWSKYQEISTKRSDAGHLGGKAKAKQMPSPASAFASASAVIKASTTTEAPPKEFVQKIVAWKPPAPWKTPEGKEVILEHGFDVKAAEDLWRLCREHDPACTAEQIVGALDEKFWVNYRKPRRKPIYNWPGFLLRAVPACFKKIVVLPTPPF